MRRRGFSGIESLLVFTVIAILAAVLIPVFLRVRENSRRSNCQGTLKQIAAAIRLYTADSGEHFPEVNGIPKQKRYGWADSIVPYLKDANLLQCPSEPTWPAQGIGSKSTQYTDYFFNSNMSGQSESALQSIAGTVMSGDAKPGDSRRESNGGTNRPLQRGGIERIVDRNGVPVGAAMRHLEGANYSFADGHVKWLKGSDDNTTPAIRVVPSAGTYITFRIN